MVTFKSKILKNCQHILTYPKTQCREQTVLGKGGKKQTLDQENIFARKIG